jgi:hypothetical protein
MLNVLDVSILHPPGVEVYRRVVFFLGIECQSTWSYFQSGTYIATTGIERRTHDTLGCRHV